MTFYCSFVKIALFAFIVQVTLLDAQPGPKLSPEQRQAIQTLDAARGQPVEIEAYVFRKLRERGLNLPRPIVADFLKDLRERSHTASHLLFESPSGTSIPDGYGGLAAGMLFRVSGLEILIDTLDWDPDMTPLKARRIIEELPRGAPNAPACDLRVVESWRPLYVYLTANAKTLFPSREAQFNALKLEGSRVTPYTTLADL
jgi:hypothetical protein